MKKKIRIIILIGVISYILYFFIPRSINFECVMEIPKPNDEFDMSSYIGFDYAENADRLHFWLVDFFFKSSCVRDCLTGYDDKYVENISKQLDFKRYDYIIAWQKELKELRYSPYLTKTKDGLYFDKRTPLIPTWSDVITDKVYIYRIKKNHKFRSFGP